MRELIINGVTVDLDDKTKIDLQFVSFLFTSINSISAPRSWTVSLPKSSKNLGLIQGASSSDYSGDFPYNNYVVDYYNKGFRLINSGKGILTKIGSRIEFVFTFGKAFEKIKLISEKKLTELGEGSTDFLTWNRSISLNDMTKGFGWVNFYSFTNEDRTLTTANADIPFGVLHPTVKFDYIMNKIQSFFSISLVGLSTLVGSCSLPLREFEGISTVASDEYTGSGGVVNNTPAIRYDNIATTYPEYDEGLFRAKDTTNRKVKIINLTAYITTNTNIHLLVYKYGYVFKTETILIPTFISTGVYKVQLTNFDFEFNGNDIFWGFGPYGTGDINQISSSLTFKQNGIAHYNAATTGGFFPIIPNLPDMTCADFLFQAMQLGGVFPEITDDAPDTINFYSADTIIDNIPNAKDWTNKLVKSTKRMSELSDVEFKFGNYAQKNTLAYKKDETNLLATDSFLKVENDNLELESKLVELKFAAGKRYSVSEKTIDYPLYDVKVESGVLIRNPKSQSNDVLGKIVNVGGINYLQFTDDLLWSNIKATENYAAQQTLLNKPRYIKENFYLKPEDVYNFSTKIPIYLQQYGKYYAVMKLQYRESDFSEAELLELKNV